MDCDLGENTAGKLKNLNLNNNYFTLKPIIENIKIFFLIQFFNKGDFAIAIKNLPPVYTKEELKIFLQEWWSK